MTPLDHLGPFAGPCALCGGPDKRHRLGDAIISRLRAGETIEALAEDYAIALDSMRAFVAPKTCLTCPTPIRATSKRCHPCARKHARAEALARRAGVRARFQGGEAIGSIARSLGLKVAAVQHLIHARHPRT